MINVRTRKRHIWIVATIAMVLVILLQLLGVGPLPSGRRAFGAGENYIVSTSGNDNNPGTLAAPWRTLQKAFDMRQAGTIPAGSVIGMRAGIYHEPVYSGADDLVVQGYNREKWTLDLSMDLTGPWTSIGNGVYRTQFTRPANWQGISAAAVSTRVHTAAGQNDRLAYMYVDDTIQSSNWLKPVFDGLDFTGPTNLPAGSFATDAPDPSGGYNFGGLTSNLWIKLGDSSNPASHRIRVGKYAQGFLIWGATNVTIRDMKMMLVEGNGIYGNAQALTIEDSEFLLMKNQPMTLWRLSSNHVIRNNWFHDIEYEAIHNESNSSLFENNVIENTIGAWSYWGPVGILTNGINNTIRGNTVRNLKKSQSGRSGFGFFTEQWYSYSDGQPSGTGNVYENNLVDNNQGGGIWTSGGDNETIRNNVVINNGGPGIVVVVSSGPGGGNASATNDVVYHNTVVNNGWGEDWGSGIHIQGSVNANVRNNIVYGNRTNYLQSGDVGTTLSNNTTANPLFVGTGAHPYDLTASSPAINAGVNVGITTDRRGVTRPTGGGYDAGAYEYTASPPSAPTATAIPPTPTVGPTPTPGGPTPTPVVVNGLTVTTPLALSASTASWGQTLTASVTYTNTGSTSVDVGKFIIGGRPPGGTNSGGPYYDFAPESSPVTVAAGASYTFTAARTFSDPDPIGTWYAFSTWFGTDGVSHDAPANLNKSFAITEVPVETIPTVTPTVPIANVINPLTTIRMVEDFLGGTPSNIGQVGSNNLGVNNGALNLFIDGEDNHNGIYQLNTGPVSGTISSLFTNGLYTKRPIAASSSFDITYIVRAPQADSTLRVGLTDNPLSATPVEATYFERLATDTTWYRVARHASVQNRADTGVTSTTGWVKLRIRRVDSSTIGFTVNGGTEQTLTSTLPTTSLHLVVMVSTATTVNKSIDIDYLDVRIDNIVR